MFEAIITFVSVAPPNREQFDPGGYPVTDVYRVEIDTKEGVEKFIADLVAMQDETRGGKYRILNVEHFGGPQ
jgi:hypothetical protein